MSRKKKEEIESETDDTEIESQESEFQPVSFDSEVSDETPEASSEQDSEKENVVYIQDIPVEIKDTKRKRGRKASLKPKPEIIIRRLEYKVADLIRSNPINPKHYAIAMEAAKRYRGNDREGE